MHSFPVASMVSISVCGLEKKNMKISGSQGP